MRALVALLLLLGCSVAATAATPPPHPPPGTSSCARPVAFRPAQFPQQQRIDNGWLPLVPGLGSPSRAAQTGAVGRCRTVTFTVTDLTKVIAGVRTRVVWDVDVNEGELSETELAFFAQDSRGNVWNLGEYPEEFEEGVSWEPRAPGSPAWPARRRDYTW